VSDAIHQSIHQSINQLSIIQSFNQVLRTTLHK